MKKEVLIAIIIGFTLGLIITFGIHTAQQSLKLKKQLASNQNTHLTPTPAAPTQPLTIASPDNGMVFHQANLQVTGTTTPQALISVIATDSYTTAAADFQGNFSAPITFTVVTFAPSALKVVFDWSLNL